MTPHIIPIGDHSFEVFQAGDKNSKKLALFLHGFPEVAVTWDKQIHPFVDKGYKVWAPNLRGYGNSYSPVDIASYHPKTLVQDIVDLMDESKCETITIIAHDWGAAIAWYLALEGISKIDKLIIMNVPHPYIFAREIAKWRQMKKSWYMFFFQIPYLPEKLISSGNAKSFLKGLLRMHVNKKSFSKELQKEIQNNLLRPNGVTPLLNWYRASFRNRTYLKDLYNKRIHLKIPTLMIWGEKDTALGIHTTLGTEKHVEDFTIRYIKDAGHFVQHDAAEQVNEMIHKWLNGEKVPGHHTPQNPY